MTREQWLNSAVDKLRVTLFAEHNATIPTVRVSVGFPGGGSARKRIGEYWNASACSDSIAQVFVSPTLKTAAEHLDVLVHELVHAVHPDAGHKGAFRKLALKLGLTGKMTATVASPELLERLNTLALELGEFPHGAISLSNRKKQSARLGKVSCSDCGYTARVTRKWLESQGAPLCPCNSQPMQIAEAETETEDT